MIKNKRKLIIAIALILGIILLAIVILYNTGSLGYNEYGSCFREDFRNRWRGHHRGRGYGNRHHEGRFSASFLNFPGFWILGLVLFVLIIGGYFLLRNRTSNVFKNKINCPNCDREVEDKWIKCPYCGKELK